MFEAMRAESAAQGLEAQFASCAGSQLPCLAASSLPTYRIGEHEPGTLLRMLLEGQGMVWMEGLPAVPFESWRRQLQRFRNDPGLSADKAVVKFSMNAERLGRATHIKGNLAIEGLGDCGDVEVKAEPRVSFDVKDAVTQDCSKDYGFFRSQYAAMANVLKPLLLDELAAMVSDSCLHESNLERSILRHNFYPSGGSCGEHTDYGLMTVVHSSTGGLQVRRRGKWCLVPPLEHNMYIAFAGDMLERLTSGAIRALPHRVQVDASEEDDVVRQSGVFFVQPSDCDQVVPSPAFRTWAEENGCNCFDYEPVLFKDWHDAKKCLAYKDA